MDARSRILGSTIGLAVSGLAAAAFLGGCDIPDPIKAEHKDPTHNWISDYGFQAPAGRTGTAGEALPSWYRAFAGNTGDSFEYVTFAETGAAAGASAPAGLSPDAPAYRLRLENLMTDPDLEAEALGTPVSRFSLNNTASGSASSIAIVADASAVHGKSFAFDRIADGDTITMSLASFMRNAVAPGQGPIAGSIYQLNFLLKSADGNQSLAYTDASREDLTLPINAGQLNDVRINTPSFADPALDYPMILGPRGAQRGAIDDIRIVRLGIPYGLVLDLRPSDCAPGLISGRYSFSVWVKDDPEASDLIADPAARAPYRCRALTLEIRSASTGAADGGVFNVIDTPAAGYPEWTRLTVSFSAGDTLSFDPTSTEAVFSLRVIPTDLRTPLRVDAGSILVAQPELNFFLE
jgi:hypothetical protein